MWMFSPILIISFVKFLFLFKSDKELWSLYSLKLIAEQTSTKHNKARSTNMNIPTFFAIVIKLCGFRANELRKNGNVVRLPQIGRGRLLLTKWKYVFARTIANPSSI